MQKLFFLIIFTIGIFVQSSAQVPNKLYMGDGIELDFTAGAPVYNNTGITYGWGAIATTTTPAGEIIFYTNGENVFLPDHSIMQNGTLIDGDTSSDTPLSIPKPGTTDEYYIFYRNTNGDLAYAEVNMQGGGMLTNQGTVLHNNITDGIQAITHCEGEDIWIVTHEVGNTNFLSFRVTPNGISTNPVITDIPNNFNHTVPENATMAFDPVFGRISNIMSINIETYYLEVVDFDRSLGTVDLHISDFGFDQFAIIKPYAEFSVDGLFLYNTLDISIKKFDVNSGSNINICFDCEPGAITRAIDNKYYTSSGSDIPHLYVFDDNTAPGGFTLFSTDPSSWFAATNYYLALPAIECETVVPLTISATVEQPLCSYQFGSVDVNVSGGVPPYTYSWDSADLSGSDVMNVASGNYSVTVTDTENSQISTSVTIEEGNTIDATITTTGTAPNQADGSASIEFNGSTPSEIYWLTNPFQTGLEAIGLVAGAYQVEVIDLDSCVFLIDFEIDEITSVFEIGKTDDFRISPSLTDQISSISTPHAIAQKNWKLYDMTGSLLTSGNWKSTKTDIDLGLFPSGLYVIRIEHLGSEFIGKVVKK